jgi:hypothetical protein
MNCAHLHRRVPCVVCGGTPPSWPPPPIYASERLETSSPAISHATQRPLRFPESLPSHSSDFSILLLMLPPASRSVLHAPIGPGCYFVQLPSDFSILLLMLPPASRSMLHAPIRPGCYFVQLPMEWSWDEWRFRAPSFLWT